MTDREELHGTAARLNLVADFLGIVAESLVDVELEGDRIVRLRLYPRHPAAVLTVACPSCCARIGAACTTKKGTTTRPHAGRLRAVL